MEGANGSRNREFIVPVRKRSFCFLRECSAQGLRDWGIPLFMPIRNAGMLGRQDLRHFQHFHIQRCMFFNGIFKRCANDLLVFQADHYLRGTFQ